MILAILIAPALTPVTVSELLGRVFNFLTKLASRHELEEREETVKKKNSEEGKWLNLRFCYISM